MSAHSNRIMRVYSEWVWKRNDSHLQLTDGLMRMNHRRIEWWISFHIAWIAESVGWGVLNSVIWLRCDCVMCDTFLCYNPTKIRGWLRKMHNFVKIEKERKKKKEKTTLITKINVSVSVFFFFLFLFSCSFFFTFSSEESFIKLFVFVSIYYEMIGN